MPNHPSPKYPSDDHPTGVPQARVREAGGGEMAAVATSALVDLTVESGPFGTGPIGRPGSDVGRRFFRHRLAAASLVILIVLGGLAAFAGVVSPYPENPTLTRAVLAGGRQQPTWSHPFGTDKTGRDQLTLVLHALQKSLLVGLGVALLSTVVGVTIGALAGTRGGWLDSLLMRFTDLVLVLPALAVLLIVAKNPEPTFFGLFEFPPATEVGGMILILAALGWMPMARIVRGELLSLREREYVEGARASGASELRIALRHLLPNAIGAIIVFATLEVGLAILTEATLSFLGAGIQPPDVSLGNLIADAEDTVGTSLSYLIIFPGFVLFLVVLCVNFVGDGLRDALDPHRSRS